MNTRVVVRKLQERYPGKNIMLLPLENPTEIICEIEPTGDHPDYSVAIAIVDSSAPHVHEKTTEVYEILEGTLKLYKDGEEYILNPGDTMTISPGEVHYAVGDETWVKETSHPGWTMEDHILI